MADTMDKKCSGCAFADFRFNDAPAGSGYSTFLCGKLHKFRDYGDTDCGEWEDRNKEVTNGLQPF